MFVRFDETLEMGVYVLTEVNHGCLFLKNKTVFLPEKRSKHMNLFCN